MARTPSLAEILEAAIATALDGVSVALPGRVVAYDAASQTADVQPTVRQPLRTLQGGLAHADLFPVLPSVPVAWPSGGGHFAAFALAPGDPVLLVFSDTAAGEYLETGEDSAPRDGRRHSLGYPTAIPGGFRPGPKALSDAPTVGTVIGKDGGTAQIHVTDTDIALGKGATDYVALASLADANFTTLALAIQAITGAPSPPPTPTVAATLAKAK